MVLVSVLVSSYALQLGSFGNGPAVGYELILVIFRCTTAALPAAVDRVKQRVQRTLARTHVSFVTDGWKNARGYLTWILMVRLVCGGLLAWFGMVAEVASL